MDDNDLAARLMAQDAQAMPAPQDDGRWMFEQMVAHETMFRRRVGRVAIVAWSVTLGTLPGAGIAAFVIRNGGGSSVEAMRAFAMVLMIVGVISFVGAALSSIAWLFRGSRAPTLAAIERRLAALEEILLSRR